MNRHTADILKSELSKHYTPEEFPAVLAQSEKWEVLHPLDGIRVFDATPVFRNTLAKYMALIYGGAELTVGFSDKIPCDPEIIAYLRSLNIPVMENDFTGETDIVLDCGAVYRNKKVRYGFVELTRSGVIRFHDCGKPVFLADSSRIKEIETTLGTGESCLRAIQQLGYNVTGKKILVFGYGKVGRGIAMYLNDAGALVTIVDDTKKIQVPDRIKMIDMHAKKDLKQAISASWAIVAATSNENALAYLADAFNASGAMLINMGVDDAYGSSVETSRVLNSKKPLNFILDEPTHMKYIDPTMALHNAGACVLLAGNCPQNSFEPDKILESEIMREVRDAGLITGEIERMGL